MEEDDAIRSKVCPLLWTVLTGVALLIGSLSGMAGIVAAKISDEIPADLPFYIQCGTTFAFVLVSFCETGAIVTIINWIKKKMNINRRRENEMETAYQTGPFISYRDFAFCDIVTIYIGVLGVNAGLVSAIWCVTVSQNYQTNSRFNGTLWPFITTDLTLGIISPTLIIFSLLPVARIIRYVSYNRIETRKLLLWFLPFLGYEKGSKGVYWVLEDSFYYKIHNGHCGNLSTALIYTMTSLTFMFSWIYFIDEIFIQQTGLPSCMLLNYENIKQSTYCFHIHPTNLNKYINCSQDSSYSGRLFCFQFGETGNNAGIIQAFVISVILYYISVICISLAFQIMKWLQQHARSYIWPTLIVIIGFVAFFLGIISFAYNLYFNSNLNILTLFQILILCANICVVGVLTTGGQLMSDPQSFSESNSIELTSFDTPGAFSNVIREGNNQMTITSNPHILEGGPNSSSPCASPPPDITTPTSSNVALATPMTLPPASPPESVSPPPPSSTPPPPLSSMSTLNTQETSSLVNSPVQPVLDAATEQVRYNTEETTTSPDNETSESQTTVESPIQMLGAEPQNISVPQPSTICDQSQNSITVLRMQRQPVGVRRMPYIIPSYVGLPKQNHRVNIPVRIQYANIPPAQVAVPVYISHNIPSEGELHTVRNMTIV